LDANKSTPLDYFLQKPRDLYWRLARLEMLQAIFKAENFQAPKTTPEEVYQKHFIVLGHAKNALDKVKQIPDIPQILINNAETKIQEAERQSTLMREKLYPLIHA
jgi:hypothetical protein